MKKGINSPVQIFSAITHGEIWGVSKMKNANRLVEGFFFGLGDEQFHFRVQSKPDNQFVSVRKVQDLRHSNVDIFLVKVVKSIRDGSSQAGDFCAQSLGKIITSL